VPGQVGDASLELVGDAGKYIVVGEIRVNGKLRTRRIPCLWVSCP
jgi:hypothetical protein